MDDYLGLITTKFFEKYSLKLQGNFQGILDNKYLFFLITLKLFLAEILKIQKIIL